MAITLGSATNFAAASNINSLANNAAKPLGEVTNSASAAAHDYLVRFQATLASTGVSATGRIDLYYIASLESGANYTDGISPGTTSSIASSLKNAVLIRVLDANANNLVVRFNGSLAGLGIAQPAPFWTIVALNASGASLPASGHAASYRAVTLS